MKLSLGLIVRTVTQSLLYSLIQRLLTTLSLLLRYMIYRFVTSKMKSQYTTETRLQQTIVTFTIFLQFSALLRFRSKSSRITNYSFILSFCLLAIKTQQNNTTTNMFWFENKRWMNLTVGITSYLNFAPMFWYFTVLSIYLLSETIFWRSVSRNSKFNGAAPNLPIYFFYVNNKIISHLYKISGENFQAAE